MAFSVNIHVFGCRNINVFDYVALSLVVLGLLHNESYMCHIASLKYKKKVFCIPKYIWLQK